MAGGPSTPELAAAVVAAGGLGFVAAGYKTAESFRADVEATRRAAGRGFGVNLFVPGRGPAHRGVYEPFARRLRETSGVEPGEPRFDDDAWEEKLALLRADPVTVVSFTFGCPPPTVVRDLRAAGSEVWVTVTEVPEAVEAVAAGADALVVQGVEAGGHRATFRDEDGAGEVSLLALLQLVGVAVDVPLVASGGIATGRAVAAVLAAGAAAAQIGTALMRCPEAGTSEPHRARLARPARTALTRAFTGRTARGIVNRFLREHSGDAPAAYPEIHHLTAPLRARGRKAGDAEVLNLWAGQTHELARDASAADVVRGLAADARAALDDARGRLPGG